MTKARKRLSGAVAGLVVCAAASAQAPTWARAEVSQEEVGRVEAVVSRSLKDPESARFRGIFKLESSTGGEAYCGMVNARNSYGGYTGETMFYLNQDMDVLEMADTRTGAIIVPAACNK